MRCCRGDTQLAAAMKDAIASGRLQVTACLILGLPLTPDGPLRPITLPCCGLVVSHAGGQHSARLGRCQLCNVPLPPECPARFRDNTAVAAAVAAEELGVAPPLLHCSDVEVDWAECIAAGGEGAVYRGRLHDRAVAVKVVSLSTPARRARDVASVQNVVAASFLAAIASPHVCEVLGYCWNGSDLWCGFLLVFLFSPALLKIRLCLLPAAGVVSVEQRSREREPCVRACAHACMHAAASRPAR